MKRSIVNDKVIRAMAIGISAMLATTTPMTALAAGEGEGAAPEPDTGEETKSESKVAEAADSASDSVDTAQSSADTVKDEVEAKVKEGEAGTDSEGKDLAQDVKDAAANVENTEVKEGAPLNNAKTDITNANLQIGVAEAKDELSDTAYGQAENAAADAATIASDAKKAMNEANAKADEQVQQIEDATTVADANAAYEALEATADQAQKDFDTKLATYNEAKNAYDAAAAKVKEYEDAYNTAVANADSNAAAAQKALEQAKANADALEQAVTAAKDAVDASAKGAMEIANMEDTTRTDGGLNWKNEDKLFITIMEKYYLPETQDIKDATVTRVQGKDNNEYNYFKATYIENGVEKVKYFNYKMDDNGKSKDDIVIFEKREVEIFGDSNKTPDQYVKDTDQKTVVDVAAGVEGGTVVDAGGKYYEYESKEDKPLVSDSEITGTSKEDVTVDEDSKQESWSYNAETGELVKTVTANVTTITYTGATFTSDKSYATDAERDAAAEATVKELDTASGKDVTITETEETTYTATGTYIPTFTKTVNVNKKYESGCWWYEADSKKEAEDKAYDWAKDQIDDDLGDYYLIGNIKSELSVSMTEEETESYNTLFGPVTVVTDDSDYLVTGTVSATYAKVTKDTIDQSTFGSLWDDIKALIRKGETTNEKLEAAARAAVEADGGIFLSADWVDWKYNKATIRYVKGYKVTSGEKQTEKEAKEAVQELVDKQVNDQKATGVYNTNVATDSKTTYSYTVDYLQKFSENTENKDVATETYSNAVGLSGQIIQNKNYIDGNILLTQKDEGYRKFVDDAKTLTGKYESLLKEAEKAKADVAAAQDKVKDLQDEIDKLKSKNSNTQALATLEKQLESAKTDRDKAEKTLNKILEKLENAGITRDEVVDRLTPNTPGGGDGGNGGNPGGGTPGMTEADPGAGTTAGGLATVMTTTTTTTTNVAVAAQAPAGNAGAGNVVAGNAGAGNAGAGNQAVVNIDDEATPLAAGIEEQDTTDNEKADEDANTVTIEDEETALAASVDQEKMSWWWLLIVLVLGATGYEMYRKHQEKKKAAEEIKVEE